MTTQKFYPLIQQINTDTLQTVQIQMRRIVTIYTVCHSVTDFWLKSLFATMNVSKFSDGKVHVRNLGIKELKLKGDLRQVTEIFFRYGLPCENVVSGICGQQRPRSNCAESLDTIAWRANACMRPCTYAEWCESAPFAHARRYFFAWQALNVRLSACVSPFTAVSYL